MSFMKFLKSDVYLKLSDMKNGLTEQEARWALGVGLVLRKTRRDAYLVQEDVAYKAGMGRLTMQRIEYGTTNPNLVTLLRLCSALNIQPSKLLMEVEKLMRHPKSFQVALDARDAELLSTRSRVEKAPVKDSKAKD